MKIIFGDGAERDFPQKVTGAFAAMARGDASPAQQREVLKTIFELTRPFGFTPMSAPERAAGFAEGARWVGIAVSQLVGGSEPWTLRHLGDVKHDDGSDRS